MATKADTLAKLRDIRDRGVLEVVIDGRTIRYPSADDLNKRIAVLEGEVATEQGTARPRTLLVGFRKGVF